MCIELDKKKMRFSEIELCFIQPKELWFASWIVFFICLETEGVICKSVFFSSLVICESVSLVTFGGGKKMRVS